MNKQARKLGRAAATRRRLVLAKETVRTVAPGQLVQVAGGVTTCPTGSSPMPPPTLDLKSATCPEPI